MRSAIIWTTMVVAMMTELTCPQAAEHLNDYLDDALPHALRQGMAAHLGACARCSRALEDLRCTRRLLRSLPRETIPARLKSDLLDVLRRLRPPDR